jgi:hypothetical protein
VAHKQVERAHGHRHPDLGQEEGAAERRRVFPGVLNDTFTAGPVPGNNAFFGLNVLKGLVDGLDDFLSDFGEPEARWRSRELMSASSST